MRAYIIDADLRRRDVLTRSMLQVGWHAEIFDSASEFLSFKTDGGFILVYDEPGCNKNIENMNVWKGTRRPLPVVFYAVERQIEQVIRAMRAGATDYLEWPVAPEKVHALTTIIDNRAERVRCEEERRFEARQLVSSLSRRERETLTLLTMGGSSKLIGKKLNISHRTVEVHRASALRKIGAESTADAVRIGVYAGLDLLN